MRLRHLLPLMAVLWAGTASAQSWCTTLTDTATCTTPVALLVPQSRDQTAYYVISGAATTDSNLIDVRTCGEIKIHHIKVAATDLSTFNLYSCPNNEKTNCSLICADYGNGTECPAAWFTGDDGTDIDGLDSTKNNRSQVWWGPDTFLYIDTITAPAVGDMKVAITCVQ